MKRINVALVGYQYLYRNGDTDFHRKMVELGIARGKGYSLGYPLVMIETNGVEYYPSDFKDEEHAKSFGITVTHSVEEFVNTIKELQNKHD